MAGSEAGPSLQQRIVETEGVSTYELDCLDVSRCRRWVRRSFSDLE